MLKVHVRYNRNGLNLEHRLPSTVSRSPVEHASLLRHFLCRYLVINLSHRHVLQETEIGYHQSHAL